MTLSQAEARELHLRAWRMRAAEHLNRIHRPDLAREAAAGLLDPEWSRK